MPRELSLFEQTTSILTASMLTACLVTPFDVIKTRMQIQIDYKIKKEHFDCLDNTCIACTGEKQLKFNSTIVKLYLI